MNSSVSQRLTSIGEAASEARPQAKLTVARLTLNRFRNYQHLRLDVDGDSVVLTGENGAGKTNVLEALSFLVPGSGLRGAKLSEIVCRDPAADLTVSDEASWAVAATVEGGNGPAVDLGTGLEDKKDTTKSNARLKRVVHVDAQPQRTQAVLAEHFACHWLTPQMDRLFQGGSEGRRRFLDRLVFSLDPAHAGRTSAYMHARSERRRLLKENRGDDAWLAALEETMAAKGVAVAAARLDMTQRLAHECARHAGPFPAAGLAVDGLAETWLGEYPALEVESRLKELLHASRGFDGAQESAAAHEVQRGRLPHQSDLMVTHMPKNMPAGGCSTGEQKMLLVGLVLAAARMAAADAGRVPVLLLDEVAAHLDEKHLDALFAEVFDIGAQTWFTGTDGARFKPLNGHARFFEISQGAISATN